MLKFRFRPVKVQNVLLLRRNKISELLKTLNKVFLGRTKIANAFERMINALEIYERAMKDNENLY